MIEKYFKIYFIFAILILSSFTAANIADTNDTIVDIWTQANRILSFLLNKCLLSDIQDLHQLQGNGNAALTLEDCLKRRGLRALDRALSRDTIAITDNIVLVKRENVTNADNKIDRLWSDQIMKRHSKYLKTVASWYQELVPRIVHFLRTRVIRISLPKIDEPISQQTEGRHRHKNNALSQMLMFGLVAAGLIVIPMGFQFLAVLGGKALLLAKLALILTSIQGLKKIATSNVNYGLYSTGYASPWQYDRKWPYEGDQYSSTLLTAPVAEHYHPLSSVLPSHYPNLNPRGEDYLGT